MRSDEDYEYAMMPRLLHLTFELKLKAVLDTSEIIDHDNDFDS